MKMKRLIASVSAGFEDFVAKVENHEAVADSMIREVREAAAQVRVQRGRLRSQIDRLERRQVELGAAEARWNERALSQAESDEATALACVSRAREAAGRREVVATQLEQHRGLADDLQRRLADLEQRLSELQLKRTALSARSARALAARTSRAPVCESVDAVFDRWETSVVADEYLDDETLEASDSLEQTFRKAEDTAALKAHLEALKAERGGES